MRSISRVLVAGTHSGCGKTTLASGLMAALAARGLVVQPFKVGPDFIDPTHHSAICGRVSRNLDPFMMGEAGVRETFVRACAGADVAVVEGVMGLYDGIDGGDVASTAHVAKILDAPVLLVVDAKGASRSVHAVVRGYAEFDPGVRVAGVVFNRVGSPRHRALIAATESLPVYGWVPRRDDLVVGSRHLGLAMAAETGTMAGFGAVVEETCDLSGVLDLARAAPPLPAPAEATEKPDVGVRIGVANDAAFCFYYADNLDRLRRAGGEPVFFSPIADRLPDVDALYLGGGYPELHAEALMSSRCREDVHRAVDDGMPVYAECGGLVYLTERLTVGDDDYPMADVLPASAAMTNRIQALGYVEARAVGGSPVLAPGSTFRGHEFHYSRLDCASDTRFALELLRGRGICNGRDGLTVQNVVGQYTHAYFPEGFAETLVRAAGTYRRV
ncbi:MULTISPECIES: cobyrinate a,c-diamide synthase [unclassified Methanoculleus]|jgi:cobyrinic acid a,c-diamide synthase|uniref:Cobyrinate a,c-diamide synthase n=1 Tax=Methanoculleus palmolei TaxID=72612 RepID=A0ABD8A867_9EURY|nr:cobyrinate a,c-diamide synthase [Methanoculleus sp. UBA377]MDD2474215.1 cobyrinate a,c-diamide synthase [Methanoculleus sp.]WOX55228.1 cobyrinate a,c-diamide synthase [Methanoculleus palmolei]